MKTNYLKRYCGQNLEVKEDVADGNQDGLTGVEEDARKLGCRNLILKVPCIMIQFYEDDQQDATG